MFSNAQLTVFIHHYCQYLWVNNRIIFDLRVANMAIADPRTLNELKEQLSPRSRHIASVIDGPDT